MGFFLADSNPLQQIKVTLNNKSHGLNLKENN